MSFSEIKIQKPASYMAGYNQNKIAMNAIAAQIKITRAELAKLRAEHDACLQRQAYYERKIKSKFQREYKNGK